MGQDRESTELGRQTVGLGFMHGNAVEQAGVGCGWLTECALLSDVGFIPVLVHRTR